MPMILNEHPLEDDYPIYGDYLYVVDGKVYRSDYHGIRCDRLKKLLGASVITNCDIFGRKEMLNSWSHSRI